MPKDDGRDIIIVSDFHLSSGYDPQAGTFSRNEDFFYDAAFARFLDHLRTRAIKEQRRWRLLILGDLFDFLQVELTAPYQAQHHSDTSDETACAKLHRIAAGHPQFFEALGQFVADGFPIDIVPGNHDIELLRPSVQEHFRGLIAHFSGHPEVVANIAFHPWIYYIPELLYAEHGHQYHDINWFAALLQPYLNQHSEPIERPLAAAFHGYLYSLIDTIDPRATTVKPPTRYLLQAFRARPTLLLTTLPDHIRFTQTILRYLFRLPGVAQSAKRASYHEAAMQAYSNEVGLSYELIVAIDQLAADVAMAIKQRLLRKFVFRPLMRSTPSLAALLAMYGALRRMRPTLGSFALFAVGALSLVRRKRSPIRSPTRSSDYLHHAVRAIRQLLQTANKSVPYYVFGHTHVAEQFPLAFGATAPSYLNSGTWTQIIPPDFEAPSSREYFTFIEITRASGSATPAGRLLFWNDAAGQHEPLPLLRM